MENMFVFKRDEMDSHVSDSKEELKKALERSDYRKAKEAEQKKSSLEKSRKDLIGV